MQYLGVRFLVALSFVLPITFSVNANDCENSMTTLEINHCAETDFERAEMLLQEVFESVLEKHKHNDALLALLNESQMQWLNYRASYCDVIYQQWIDGSIRNLKTIKCKTMITKSRSQQLRADFINEL